MIALELLKQIQNVWESERKRCNAPIKVCPGIEDLRVMIGTAFFASLKREEGNPISFSLALITEQEINDGSSWSDEFKNQVKMKFPKPLPFTVETISKLAQAFDMNCNALAVEVSKEDNSVYQIWGAIYFDKSKYDGFHFEQITFGGPNFYTYPPECFMVKASSAGFLTISFGNHNMGYIENGEFVRSIPDPFAVKASFQPYVEKILRENRWFDMKHWHDYKDSLKKVIFDASEWGGGTIIFIPPSKIADVKPYLKCTYSFPGDLGISNLLSQTVQEREKNGFSHLYPQMRSILAKRLTALSKLAAIDGALIITSEWEVIGFGVKLEAEKWKHEVIVGPSGFDVPFLDTEFDHTKFGMRHNSAINFVGAFFDVIAFVISEDGPIRAFVKKNDDTILCWKDLRVVLVA